MVRLAANAADEAVLLRNLTVAFKVSDWFADKNHLNLWDVRDVMVTMLVTESGGGFIYANDGEGYREPTTAADRTPWNWNPQTNKPVGTPEARARMREVLRRSLDLPHDKVGSNGRSTGPAQQLSAETGGGWGPMAATMRMDLSVLMFLDAVNWADRSPFYLGKQMANWQTAMLLRVQRPLASEVATNYGSAQLARAQAIVRDERFTPGAPTVTDWWSLMAENFEEAKQELKDMFHAELPGIVAGAVKEPTVPVRRVHAYRSDDVSAPHLVANLDAGTWWWVPAGDIELVWGVQKSLFGDGAKDWIDVPYSGGKTHVDRPDVFGVQVHIYDGL